PLVMRVSQSFGVRQHGCRTNRAPDQVQVLAVSLRVTGITYGQRTSIWLDHPSYRILTGVLSPQRTIAIGQPNSCTIFSCVVRHEPAPCGVNLPPVPTHPRHQSHVPAGFALCPALTGA
ncbi:hypothetical protein, partial [Chloroflexus aurantiacus]